MPPVRRRAYRWRFRFARLCGCEAGATTGFSFYGPTCDDMDFMAGPFNLPDSIKADDYIEIGMIGAYGSAMRTKFNGYGSSHEYDVSDEPMASLYVGDNLDRSDRDNVVSFPSA